MHVTPVRGAVAGGEPTGPITSDDRSALPGRSGPHSLADIERLRWSIDDDAGNAGVAGEATGGFGCDRTHVIDLARAPGAAFQGLEIDEDVDVRSLPAHVDHTDVEKSATDLDQSLRSSPSWRPILAPRCTCSTRPQQAVEGTQHGFAPFGVQEPVDSNRPLEGLRDMKVRSLPSIESAPWTVECLSPVIDHLAIGGHAQPGGDIGQDLFIAGELDRVGLTRPGQHSHLGVRQVAGCETLGHHRHGFEGPSNKHLFSSRGPGHVACTLQESRG